MHLKNCIPVFIFSAVSSLLFLTGCEDIFDEELDDKIVSIVAPSDSAVSENYTQLFVWETVEGADEYQIRIVQPDFTYINEIIVDSTIATNQFSYNLYPGTFQWGVRAKNGSSESLWSVRTIVIDSSLDLSNSLVQLLTPISNYSTNDTGNITFSWNALENASNYRLKVVEGSSFEAGTLIHEGAISSTSVSYGIGSEGTYYWGVRAENELYNSEYSSRKLIIDLTSPQVPEISSPINGSILYNPVDVLWQSGESTDTDTLFIASDSLFSSVLQTIASDSLSYTGNLPSGYVYLKVKRTDLSGNQTESSGQVKVYVQ